MITTRARTPVTTHPARTSGILELFIPQFMGTWKGSEISKPPAVTLAIWNLFIMDLSRITHALKRVLHERPRLLLAHIVRVLLSRNSGRAM